MIGRLLEGLPLDWKVFAFDWKVIGRLLEGFVGRALNGGRIFHFEVGGGETLFDRSILHLGLYLEFYNADNQLSMVGYSPAIHQNRLWSERSARSARSPFSATLQKPSNEEMEHVMI